MSTPEKNLTQLGINDLLLDKNPWELPKGDSTEAIFLLQQWRNDSSETDEQRETMDYLARVLDEDRLSANRKLFVA